MTGPTKIDHVSTKCTELYFSIIFSSECGLPFLWISDKNPLNSAVVANILCYWYVWFSSYDRAKLKKLMIFCIYMVDFHRPGHICLRQFLIQLKLLNNLLIELYPVLLNCWESFIKLIYNQVKSILYTITYAKIYSQFLMSFSLLEYVIVTTSLCQCYPLSTSLCVIYAPFSQRPPSTQWTLYSTLYLVWERKIDP